MSELAGQPATSPAQPGSATLGGRHIAGDHASPGSVGLAAPSLTLWRREMVRFFRQRSRVTGALLTPVIFWLMLGSGLNNNFVLGDTGGRGEAAAAQVSYLAYFFPGTIVMILLFTAIFSTFSVIEDRKEGFMQAVLVSPAPRLSIVLGKVLGCASIATIQAALFLLAWPIIGDFGDAGFGGGDALRMLGSLPIMFLLGMGLAAMGFCLAWKIDSTAGFHAIMNLLLMPMWFLCGAVFPVPESGVLRYIMLANPLTYGQSAFSGVLTGQGNPIHLPVAGAAPMLIAAVLVVLAVIWAGRTVSKPKKSGLP